MNQPPKNEAPVADNATAIERQIADAMDKHRRSRSANQKTYHNELPDQKISLDNDVSPEVMAQSSQDDALPHDLYGKVTPENEANPQESPKKSKTLIYGVFAVLLITLLIALLGRNYLTSVNTPIHSVVSEQTRPATTEPSPTLSPASGQSAGKIADESHHIKLQERIEPEQTVTLAGNEPDNSFSDSSSIERIQQQYIAALSKLDDEQKQRYIEKLLSTAGLSATLKKTITTGDASKALEKSRHIDNPSPESVKNTLEINRGNDLPALEKIASPKADESKAFVKNSSKKDTADLADEKLQELPANQQSQKLSQRAAKTKAATTEKITAKPDATIDTNSNKLVLSSGEALTISVITRGNISGNNFTASNDGASLMIEISYRNFANAVLSAKNRFKVRLRNHQDPLLLAETALEILGERGRKSFLMRPQLLPQASGRYQIELLQGGKLLMTYAFSL